MCTKFITARRRRTFFALLKSFCFISSAQTMSAQYTMCIWWEPNAEMSIPACLMLTTHNKWCTRRMAVREHERPQKCPEMKITFYDKIRFRLSIFFYSVFLLVFKFERLRRMWDAWKTFWHCDGPESLISIRPGRTRVDRIEVTDK